MGTVGTCGGVSTDVFADSLCGGGEWACATAKTGTRSVRCGMATGENAGPAVVTCVWWDSIRW